MGNEMMGQGEILLYSNGSDKEYVSVVFKDETFWLTQKAMAELFDVNVPAVSKHLQNIYEEQELSRDATISKMETVRQEGERQVKRTVDFYNLDAIIAVGYRVNSKKATRFRQWATKTLKEYIQKGFVLNDEMMKNGRPFGKDYFDELLERIPGNPRPASVELTRKLPMCLSSAATTTTKTAKPRKRSMPSCRTSCTMPSPA